jgi:hypothetical protein
MAAQRKAQAPARRSTRGCPPARRLRPVRASQPSLTPWANDPNRKDAPQKTVQHGYYPDVPPATPSAPPLPTANDNLAWRQPQTQQQQAPSSSQRSPMAPGGPPEPEEGAGGGLARGLLLDVLLPGALGAAGGYGLLGLAPSAELGIAAAAGVALRFVVRVSKGGRVQAHACV